MAALTKVREFQMHRVCKSTFAFSLPHIAQIVSVHILRPLVALDGKGGEEYGLSQHLYIHT